MLSFLSASTLISDVGSIILAIALLLAMITVHEFGHYVAGKALKFKINEFAVGFGPKLFSRTSEKSGEVFSIRAFPLGGFCAFEGEDGEDGEKSENAFVNKSPAKRIAVLVAGPAANYLTAVIVILISLFTFGQTVLKINGVLPPTDETYVGYSLEDGDCILRVDGKSVYLVSDIMSALAGKSAGEKVKFTLSNGGVVREQEIMPRIDCDFENSGDTKKIWSALGIAQYESDGKNYWSIGTENYRFSFFETIGRAFDYSFRLAGTIFKVLGELLTGQLGLKAVGGPVTTVKLTAQIASQSFQNFLDIAAYMGVNLAIFNLLPIPALDGSKTIFCLIEGIFKKPVPRGVEAIIHAAGFVLILAFSVIVDILQFI